MAKGKSQDDALTSEFDGRVEFLNLFIDEGGARVGFEELERRITSQISIHVNRISELTTGCDAYDVLELMRQFAIIAPNLDSNREPNAALVELVAVILLARGNRENEGVDNAYRAHENINLISDSAKAILTLGSFLLHVQGELAEAPTSEIVTKSLVSSLHIRNLQYQEIRDVLNRELFEGNDFFDRVMSFSITDFHEIREAVKSNYLDAFENDVKTFVKIATNWDTEESEIEKAKKKNLGKSAIHDAFFTPGVRASFNSIEIANLLKKDLQLTDLVLATFSTPFSKADPYQAVTEFINGSNPFLHSPLIVDQNANYFQVSQEIGTDALRQMFEIKCGQNKEVGEEYRLHRAKVAEDVSVAAIQRLLQDENAYKSLEYFAPILETDLGKLSGAAVEITRFAKKCEADALFIVEDVAICVEVKSSSLTKKAKSGHWGKLRKELVNSIGNATSQSSRLAQLIEANQGLWLADETWFSLSSIREVRSIVVTLDEMAPLALEFDSLVREGIVATEKYPWIVSVHDLLVVSKILNRAPSFLHYLRRRTEANATKIFKAFDELDLFMLFLSGGLYVEPDPDVIFKKHPKSVPPNSQIRKSFERQAKTIFVPNLTGPLDDWFDSQEAGSHVEKPELRANSTVLGLIDFLSIGKKPGWFRFSADLLGLSSSAQSELAGHISGIVKQVKRDGESHSFAMSFAGPWGYPIIVGISNPSGWKPSTGISKLAAYLAAKKHQLESDRALGLLLNQNGEILAVNYLNSVPGIDPQLDDLIEVMNLKSIKDMQRPIPPSAKRAKKRLRKKKN